MGECDVIRAVTELWLEAGLARGVMEEYACCVSQHTS
jgi:hypothetical protein